MVEMLILARIGLRAVVRQSSMILVFCCWRLPIFGVQMCGAECAELVKGKWACAPARLSGWLSPPPLPTCLFNRHLQTVCRRGAACEPVFKENLL